MDLTDVVAISYAHEDISFNEKVIGFVNCLDLLELKEILDEYEDHSNLFPNEYDGSHSYD